MKSMLEMTMRVRENVFTRIKKTMTKKMYVLYYENHKDEMTKQEFENKLERSYRHLDACKFKDKGWPCPTCPECCFKGKDYDNMMTVMNYAQQWAEENPKQAWKMKPPVSPHKH